LADTPRAAPTRAPRIGAGIGAVAIALPEQVRTNQPIAARLGVDEEWIVARTGVRERRIAAEGEGVVELGARAASRSLAAAGLDPIEVDLVLVATMSHDQLTPPAAPLVAERIGAAHPGALDLNAVCSGFVYAIGLATAQVESGRARHVLVIGADVMSRVTDPGDRATAALFGDGAGAVLVSEIAATSRIGPVVLGADGAQGGLVTASREMPLLRMKGHETFRQAVDRLCEATADAADAAGVCLDEIDAFVYHQANKRILAAVGERLSLDQTRVVECIDRCANTSAATVPIALDAATTSGQIWPGARVLIAAFGGGLTWGATVVEWELGDREIEHGDDA